MACASLQDHGRRAKAACAFGASPGRCKNLERRRMKEHENYGIMGGYFVMTTRTRGKTGTGQDALPQVQQCLRELVLGLSRLLVVLVGSRMQSKRHHLRILPWILRCASAILN